MLINSFLLLGGLFQFFISGSQSHPHPRTSKDTTWSKTSLACLRGHNDKTLTTSTFEACKEKCLEETDFGCESVDYFPTDKECQLSTTRSTSNDYEEPCYGPYVGNLYAERIHDDGCPPPWFSIGEQCFRVIMEESLDWTSARDHCNTQAPCGGDLAQPNDVKAIADYLNVNDYPNGYDNGYWLGGSDRNTEGEWRWVNNSIITTATGWAHREPNDDYSCEDCLSMRPGWDAAKSLKDEGCGMIQHFICERHICPDCPPDFIAIYVTNDVLCFKLLPEVPVTNHIANGIVALPFPGIVNPMGGSTMEESQARCKDEGLILAQPTHESAYAINRYIYKTYEVQS